MLQGGREAERGAVENINPCGNLWCVELKMKYNKMLYMQAQCTEDATIPIRAARGSKREGERKGVGLRGVCKNKGHTRVTIIKFINVEQFCISCPGAKHK